MSRIIFHPSSQEHYFSVPHPKPASQYKAAWWEESPSFYEAENLYKDSSNNLTIKHCIPFRDSLFSGYIQESWQDIRFDIQDDTFEYHFPTQPDIISHRDHSSLPVGNEFYPIEFVVKVPWMPETPPGWSVLITQPFNRPDLPFYSPAGIVDTDHLNRSAGVANFPLYLRKDSSSIVRAGTPLYQIIPFKRDSWVSEIAEYDEKAQKKILMTLHKTFWGGYKKSFWQKKSYK